MRYETALRRLAQLRRPGPQGLRADADLLAVPSALRELLGDPIASIPGHVLHVAGTNGKGSVACKLTNALHTARPSSDDDSADRHGHLAKVGTFTSPHISSWRERIRVNNELISEADAALELTQIFALLDENKLDASMFEALTALAALHFRSQECRHVVFEAGVGGELDATTAMIQPYGIGIVTSVARDHVALLGSDLAGIARAKLGIVPRGSTVFVSNQVYTLAQRDAEVGKVLEKYDVRHVDPSDVNNLKDHFSPQADMPEYEWQNAALCDLVLRHLGVEYADEALLCRPPCRAQWIGNVMLDTAHNEEAVREALANAERWALNSTLHVAFGCSADKDATSMLKCVQDYANVVLHPVSAESPRSMPVDNIVRVATELVRNAYLRRVHLGML
ncbi:MAG: hypothetical protein MHM6MM_008455 [Cercozoa sp. M6MM]